MLTTIFREIPANDRLIVILTFAQLVSAFLMMFVFPIIFNILIILKIEERLGKK